MGPVGAGRQYFAVPHSSPYKHYLVSRLYQRIAGAVDPLVGGEVVGHGNDGGFRGLRNHGYFVNGSNDALA